MGRPRGSNKPPNPPSPEIARIRHLLRALIAMAEFSIRKVERQMASEGWTLDVGRALGGRLDLRVWHVLGISRAIGVHPIEVFRMALPEPAEPSALIADIEALIRPVKSRPLEPAVAKRLLQSQAVEPNRRDQGRQ